MLEGIITALGTLLIVIAVLFAAWWVTRKIAGSGQFGGRSRYMKIIDRMPVAQDRFLVLVRLGEKVYLLGVASSEITFLAEMEGEPDPLQESEQTAPVPMDFRELMKKLGRKNNGR